MNTIQSVLVGGNKILNSEFGQGTLNLINDVTGFLTYMGPIAAVCFIAYYLIRRMSADEQQTLLYNRKMIVAAICGVSVGMVSGIITLLTSYYRG